MTDRIVYTGPTYQIVRPKRKTSDFFGYVLPTGALCTAATIGVGAIKKENRGDTFVSTAKKCIKDYSVSNKNVTSELLKEIGANGLAKKLDKVSNKKFLPFLLGVNIVFSGLFCGWLHDLIHRN